MINYFPIYLQEEKAYQYHYNNQHSNNLCIIPRKPSTFSRPNISSIQSNSILINRNKRQANTLGAAILLPENLIKQGMYLFSLGEKIECLNKIYFPGVYKRFDALADFLGCSKKALAIRMKQLGLLKKEYLDNPFDLVTVYPEVSEL
jgi:hypothetical protein